MLALTMGVPSSVCEITFAFFLGAGAVVAFFFLDVATDFAADDFLDAVLGMI